jgi:hypothetical protein
MSLIILLLVVFIVLCLVGLILWGVQQVPGIPPIVKTVVIVIIGCIILIWLLNYVLGGHAALHIT